MQEKKQDYKKISNDFNYGNELIFWNFPEFVTYKRSNRWHITAFIVITLLLLYSVLSYNFLLAVIVVMVIMIILLREKMGPKTIKFSIMEQGVIVGNNFYPFRDIKNFTVIYEPPKVKVLYLEFKSKLKPRLSISLEEENPNEVRRILKEHLAEDLVRNSESVSDALGRWLKI